MTYPLATLAAQVGPSGISAPAYADVYASLVASYQAIFGADVVLDPSTQDGQWLAVMAQAITDVNSAAVDVFNSFSPAKAQGAGLSSIVKINGIARLVASNSSADVLIVGETGAPITNGICGDAFNNQWALPPSVVIPNAGQITVTAVCLTAGAVMAGANTITKMLTPTQGWQSVTNPDAATPGNPVESDATLRARQAASTNLPASSVLDAIIGQIASLAGVEQWAAYENDTDMVDANGLPRHSISLVVLGGDATAIATVIATTKTPGTGTYGTTSEMIIDPAGVPDLINFFRPTMNRIIMNVTGLALTGYVATTAPVVAAALAAYVNALAMGDDVEWSKLWVPANLNNGPLSSTFKIVSITLAIYGNPLEASDVSTAFNAMAGLALVYNADGTVNWAASDIQVAIS
jgi:uncharacterized phage protein gp47/JayE